VLLRAEPLPEDERDAWGPPDRIIRSLRELIPLFP